MESLATHGPEMITQLCRLGPAGTRVPCPMAPNYCPRPGKLLSWREPSKPAKRCTWIGISPRALGAYRHRMASVTRMWLCTKLVCPTSNGLHWFAHVCHHPHFAFEQCHSFWEPSRGSSTLMTMSSCIHRNTGTSGSCWQIATAGSC